MAMTAADKADTKVQMALANLNALIEPLLAPSPDGGRSEAFRLMVEQEVQVIEVGNLPRRKGDPIFRIYCGMLDNTSTEGVGVVINPLTKGGGIEHHCSRCVGDEPCQHVLGAVISWHQKMKQS